MRGRIDDQQQNAERQLVRHRRTRPAADWPRESENRTAPQLWRGEGTCGSQRLGATVAPDISGCDANANTRRVVASPLTQVTAAVPPSAARSIDEQLFRPGSWRCLDADNRALRDVRPGTADQALDLIGRGRVASFYGQLRPGIVAVDIDMARSDGPVMELVGWCCEQGLWHLVRQSGRRGHQHVFIVVGDLRDDLERFAATLRSAHGVTNVRINVRDKIRPLCAPHRCEPTPPPPPLGRAARSLPGALQKLSPTDAETPSRTRYRASTAAKAVPAPYRQRRDLPPAWARYLAEGVHPPQVSNWSDQSRSAMEYRATMRMVLAGWSADQAWLAITTSHHHAMGKARANGRAWWTAYVWNPAVTAVARQTPSSSPQARSSRPQAGGPNLDVSTRAHALQAAFLTIWNRYGRDRRHTLRAVLDAVCARVARTGSATVPCPERDLVLDTGIASRRALREALAVLDSEGWLQLYRTFDPSRDEPGARSHHVGLPERIPLPTPPSGLEYPPSSYTPLPLRVRAHLGPTLHHAYLALPRDTPAACPPLLPLMGLGHPGAPPSQDQLATALARLQSLAALGLATCDEQGCWVAVAQVPTDLLEAAKDSHAHRAESVADERAAYALVRAGQGRWAHERRGAIERWRATRYHAAQRWFRGLHPAEQDARRSAWQLRFAALPPNRQAQIKQELARRRAEAGVISEDAVRRAWVESISPEQYAERVIERALAFRALAPPIQAAKAAAWAEHRARWGISLDPTPLGGPSEAEVVSETRTNEQLELLALSDVLERDPHGRLAGLQVPLRRKSEATA